MRNRIVCASMLVIGFCWSLAAVALAQDAGAAKDTPAPAVTKETEAEAPPEAVREEKRATSFDLVLNVLPASVLINVDSDKFGVTGDSGKATLSSVYIMPNIAAGIGAELWDFYVDATVGAGLVVNESFRTFLLEGLLSANYIVSDSLKIGPHLGLIYFTNPDWVGNEDLEFNDSWGLLAGLQISMGDRIMYLVSVDLVHASLDAASSEPGVDLSTDSLKMTGLAVQFGVRGEF